MKLCIVAGESSGDLHGSHLMKGILDLDPQCEIMYWGGELMDRVYTERKGVSGLVEHYRKGAVMGFVDVVRNAGALLRKLGECTRKVASYAPDCLILIDYPGFNLRVAERIHRLGIPVFYYIAPKVWASRERRLSTLRESVDRLFIVFPFEKKYFDSKGMPYIYEGNPLLDSVPLRTVSPEEGKAFFERASLEPCRYVALLPGSRKDEVSRMIPPLRSFVSLMGAIPQYCDMHFIVAGAPGREKEEYASLLECDPSRIHLLYGETPSILSHAEAGIINSGTASLEACLIGTPQVVGYATSPLNYLLAKSLIKVNWVSLTNLILGRGAVKELLQEHLTGENLLGEVRRILEDREYRETMERDYSTVRELLGGSGASGRIAKSMMEELGKVKAEKQ